MAQTNRERVQKGLELLLAGLIPYAEREFKKAFGDDWVTQVEGRTRARIDVDVNGGIRWDTSGLLKTMIEFWGEVFSQTLGRFERSVVSELLEFRNHWAHEKPFSSDDTLRALDSVHRLLTSVSAVSQAEEVEAIRFELQRLVFAEQARSKTRATVQMAAIGGGGLRPWREIVTPHQDVISGRYQQAEFAADLHNVHQGIGTPEYVDPAEFFRRTFITEGLRELLSGALMRIAGKGGDPVVELQTNFGGGKTHSMLALFHMFGGTPSNQLPGLESILTKTGIASAPAARRAVLVGTHMSVAEVVAKPDGTRVRTIWGEMAYQLGGAEAFSMVADSDAAGISPGAQVLTTLFKKYSPCLVLIDEWVAYARNTVDRRDLPSGDFESQVTFAQALTEAARASDRTLVVASIPSSKIEVGGTNGEFALTALRNVFERLGTPWRPASPDEGFEIVRRRLFDEKNDRESSAHRGAVIDAFMRMYGENKAEYPTGCADGAYRKKFEAAYPIHPDLFDQLYGEWSTLDKFQRTRGVLRLLAKVIHRLWEQNDAGILIMPASIPMDDPGVKSELTRYLDDVWEPIISEDVDGPNSLPLELDRLNSNFGRYSACRRVARTLYIGTAPGARDKNPGIDDRQVKLGCTQPGEAAATFGDALRRISDRAKHVHQDNNRYWISTKTNLNRLAEDRAGSALRERESLYAELIRRIQDAHKSKASRGDFAGVHCCPESSADVHDEPEARLVILGPQYDHRKGQTDSSAMKYAATILEQRGNGPRINRNSLVFLAADSTKTDDLLGRVAQYLAWKSISEDYETLNLDTFQRKQAGLREHEADDFVDQQIGGVWTRALVPFQGDVAGGGMIAWDDITVQGSDGLAARTSTKLKNDGLLNTVLGGQNLRQALDSWLWKDKAHVQVGQLAEWFARYLYLSRIVNRSVLYDSINNGLNQFLPGDDPFAYAAGFDEGTGRYVGLHMHGQLVVENTGLVVKREAAKRQQDADAAAAAAVAAGSVAETGGGVSGGGGQGGNPSVGGFVGGFSAFVSSGPQPGAPASVPEAKPQPNLFVGSVRLDETRVAFHAGKINEEVLQHLSTLPGAEMEVRLEVQIRVPRGTPDDVVRTVSENARTMKFTTAVFEKE